MMARTRAGGVWAAVVLGCTLIHTADATGTVSASETALPEWRDVYGIWWTLYVALFVIAFFTLFAITIWLLVRRGTFKTLTFKAIVLYINLVAVFGRLVWLIDPEDFNDLLNSAVRALLLRFPQTLQLVQVLLYIFLWKRVGDAYANNEKIKSRLSVGRYKYTLTILVAILGGGGLIVQALLAGGVAPALMQNITRGLFSIYVLGMLIGGLWYAWRLNRVLSRRAAVGGAAPLHTALSKLKRAVTVWLGVGVVWASVFLWAALAGELNAWSWLFYQFVLRGGEAVVSAGALSAVWPTSNTNRKRARFSVAVRAVLGMRRMERAAKGNQQRRSPASSRARGGSGGGQHDPVARSISVPVVTSPRAGGRGNTSGSGSKEMVGRSSSVGSGVHLTANPLETAAANIIERSGSSTELLDSDALVGAKLGGGSRGGGAQAAGNGAGARSGSSRGTAAASASAAAAVDADGADSGDDNTRDADDMF